MHGAGLNLPPQLEDRDVSPSGAIGRYPGEPKLTSILIEQRDKLQSLRVRCKELQSLCAFIGGETL
jgi:23S rRNA A2030 N6-methylase RlmJ